MPYRMKKVRRRSGQGRTAPGQPGPRGRRAPSPRTSIKLFVYNAEKCTEHALGDHRREFTTGRSRQATSPGSTSTGWTTTSVINTVGERFGLHPLLLEDVLNTDHRPKVEEYQDTLFVVVKMLSLDEETGGIVSEQVSFVLGKGFVITFQEKPGDVLDPIRERIRTRPAACAGWARTTCSTRCST